jgi:hypothetical protein
MAITLASGANADVPKKLPAYVAECRVVALQKLNELAVSNGFNLDPDSVVVSGIDDRPFNPYKYVWFKGTVTRGGVVRTIQTITQKSYLPRSKCF